MDDIVRELQRAQKRLHGQWPIDKSVVYHSVMANPKRRFQLAFAYVESAKHRPVLDSTGEWAIPPGTPDVKSHGCPLSFLHGSCRFIRATSGWGYPFIVPERCLVQIGLLNHLD